MELFGDFIGWRPKLKELYLNPPVHEYIYDMEADIEDAIVKTPIPKLRHFVYENIGHYG